MIKVYDVNGGIHLIHHAIDAKEAIATGRFFKHNPKAPAPEKASEPVAPVNMGEDIEARYIPAKGFEIDDSAEEAKAKEALEVAMAKPKEEPFETEGQAAAVAPVVATEEEAVELTTKGEIKEKEGRKRRS